MGKAIVYYSNIASDATITVSTEEATFEKEYLVDENTANTFRTTAIAAQTIKFDFTSSEEIEGIAYFNTNMNADVTTFDIQHSTNDVTYSNQENLTQAVDGYKEYNYTDRYFRFDLVKSAGTFIEVGEIYMFSKKYTFDKDISIGSPGMEKVMVETMNRGAQSGHVFRKIHDFYRRLPFRISGFDDTQRNKIEEIQDSEYVCFLPYGTDSDVVLFGTMSFYNLTPLAARDNDPANLEYDCNGSFIECAY